MRTARFSLHVGAIIALGASVPLAPAFEGQMNATIIRGTEVTPLLYTVGKNLVRIEVASTNRPHLVNIVEPKGGGLTLLFPHNRSFLRLKPTSEYSSPSLPGVSAISSPRTGPSRGFEPQVSGAPAAGMPVFPIPQRALPSPETLELQATG